MNPASNTSQDNLAEQFAAVWESAATAPDVFQFLKSHPDTTPQQRLSVLLVDQHHRWRSHQEITVVEYLDGIPALNADHTFLTELAIEEIGYLEERGAAVGPEVILNRFRSLPEPVQTKIREELLATEPSKPKTDSSTLHSGSSAAEEMKEAAALKPPQVDRFEIQRELGSGAFGVVYLAKDKELQRNVALKFPSARCIATAGGSDSFLREARLVAQLEHASIVPVFDVGTCESGDCFVVSKFVDGDSLAEVLKHGIPQDEAVRIAITVAKALHAAHRAGLVHRDIKPSNILIDSDGAPHIIDFGLALRDEEFGTGNSFVGTPAYMSPEQARGEGHRVDARSDVFSLGIVLFEMLTGQRPWRTGSAVSVLEQVRQGDVRPLRQFRDSVPRSLDRICMKALCRRATDRYGTALDFAEDLEACLSDSQSRSERESIPPSLAAQQTESMTSNRSAEASLSSQTNEQSMRIVPRGLRSFTADDADFFLQLLPGPRDRSGLPDSIQFWKRQIESSNRSGIFSVGLLYGPSGCGKSSLMKAGLLPLLSDDVDAVYVECSPRQTEARILSGLRRMSPTSKSSGSIVQTFAELRKRNERKTLVVLDQFEQWLHGWTHGEAADLIAALRHCDGKHLQVIVMVRDDFWMAATRFMRELEIRLTEGENSAAVDLFDQRHARRVLEACGRAYGALPDAGSELTPDQRRFVTQAVEDLAEDGSVIPVRLSLFAEMVKGREWDPDTLRQTGGAKGVGAAFLDDAFGAHAPPQNRLHGKAARNVMEALLPQHGENIRGAAQTRTELAEAAGYEDSSAEFGELLSVLDGGLRIITPTERSADDSVDPEGAQFLYQLTHDYLVVAVRDWLTRRRQSSARGRAELKLEQRSGLWNALPENRLLPSVTEYVTIRALTDRSRWTPQQQTMMVAAGRRVWSTVLCILAVVAALGWGGYEANGRWIAGNYRSQLLVAKTEDVPALGRRFQPYERWTTPLLQNMLNDPQPASNQRLHAILALPHRAASHLAFLAKQVPNAAGGDHRVIVDALARNKMAAVDELSVLLKTANRIGRIRVAAAIAALAPEDDIWKEIGASVTADLLEQPASLSENLVALRPVAHRLMPTLVELARDTDVARRRTATLALEQYFDGTNLELVELIESLDAEQFRIFAARLDPSNKELIDLFRRRMHLVRHTPWPQLPDSCRENQPAPWAVRELEQAHGIVDDAFAMCQTLPLARVEDVVEELRRCRYRLLKLRPFRNENGPHVAVLWTRDELNWDWGIGLTEQAVLDRNTINVENGLLAADVAGYLIEDDDEPRYAFIWAESTEPGERREFYLGLPTVDHLKQKDSFQNRGLREFARHVFTDREEYWLKHSMIWGIDSNQIDDSDFEMYPDSQMKTFARARGCPVDVCLVRAGSEEKENLKTHYGGIWLKTDPHWDRQFRMGLTPEEHVQEARQLMNLGYRPRSLSVARIEPNVLEAASVWSRPHTTLEEHHRNVVSRSNCAAALVRLGLWNEVIPLLSQAADPAMRTELIHMFHSHECDISVLAASLIAKADEADARTTQALLLALGEYAWSEVPDEWRSRLQAVVTELYQNSNDAGIHSSAEWTLRQWGSSVPALETIGDSTDDQNWYVASHGHTMCVVDAADQSEPFLMGSWYTEPDTSFDERRHNKWINRRFAIASREVTVGQFEEFAEANPNVSFARRPEEQRDLAQTRVSWFLAGRYCNWLSKLEGIPEDQWCYKIDIDESDGPRFTLAEDYLSKTGYRLPTEAEWEFACRAATFNARPCGDTTHRLSEYGWFDMNSDNRIHPVAQLKPNDFGLFDTLGNAREWCLERWGGKLTRITWINNSDHEDSLKVVRSQTRVTKGGSFKELGVKLRAANRIGFHPYLRLETHGFRVARTVK